MGGAKPPEGRKGARMGSITTGIGLISGIDTASLIDSLINLESQGKFRIQDRIASIAKTLVKGYIYEDVAKDLAGFLRGRRDDGKYADRNDHASFAKAVTEDLQGKCNDKHLRILTQSRVENRRQRRGGGGRGPG